MTEREFNLTREPWILTLTQGGQMESMSLLDLFKRAHQLRALAGEMVTQDVAILRLLLGILYAVFGREDLEGNGGVPQSDREARARWQALWERGSFPVKQIEEYLDYFEDRFFLFHSQRPFFQVVVPPEATVIKDGTTQSIGPAFREIRYVIGDVAEGGNKPRWFLHRNQLNQIDYAEAARWLVHLNSFDVSPLGAPPRGVFRARGFSVPWPNGLGLVWAEGANLFETLMLNLVLFPDGQDAWQELSPSWEREGAFDPQQLTIVNAPFPAEPAALFSFPYRYLQLKRNKEGWVEECVLWGGTLVEAEGGNPLTETMTLWKEDKEGRHVPKVHDPEQQMWRDFGVLFSSNQRKPPGVVAWLSGLQQRGLLNLSYLQLCIGGVVLSSKKTSIDDAFSDSLRFHAALIADLKEGWPQRITAELAVTYKLAQQASYLAQDLVIAAGGSGEKDSVNARAKARQEAYFALDIPFRRWLEGLDENTPMEDACKAWREIQGQIFRQLGEKMVQRAGSKALVGRSVKTGPGEGQEKLYAAPELQRWYLYHIRKILTE